MITQETIAGQTRDLIAWLEDHCDDILKQRTNWLVSKAIPPNALFVPARFGVCAAGVSYMGLRLVSVITDDDLPATEPRVCFSLFGRDAEQVRGAQYDVDQGLGP
jgi:hypothetical protein